MRKHTIQALIAGASALALLGVWAPSSAQQLPDTSGAVQGVANGHAFRSGGTAAVQRGEAQDGTQGYDVQLHLSAGRQRQEAKAVKVVILGARGERVFALDEAGALTDVALPAGHYEVLADFGHSKRMGPVEVKEGQMATLYLHGANAPN